VIEKRTKAPPGEMASALAWPRSRIVGGVVSRTVTAKLRVTSLPRESALEHATGVSPTRNVDPGDGEQETGVAPSTRSVAVAV
jgi:hypothetical protein